MIIVRVWFRWWSESHDNALLCETKFTESRNFKKKKGQKIWFLKTLFWLLPCIIMLCCYFLSTFNFTIEKLIVECCICNYNQVSNYYRLFKDCTNSLFSDISSIGCSLILVNDLISNNWFSWSKKRKVLILRRVSLPAVLYYVSLSLQYEFRMLFINIVKLLKSGAEIWISNVVRKHC